jgi:hypothetical protein
MTVDISADSSRPEYRNLPHDSHPSPLANAAYAERLEPWSAAVSRSRRVAWRLLSHEKAGTARKDYRRPHALGIAATDQGGGTVREKGQ